MSTGKIITNTINTNIILVNTATDIDTIVNLQAVNVGQSLTIRDNSGAASSNNTITINTDGTNFITTLQGITNSLIIAQPYGYATLQYESNAQWAILNTFGYALAESTYSINSLSVNTIYFTDTLTSSNVQLNVSNGIMKLNGENIIGSTQSSVFDTISANNISASNITLSSNIINPNIVVGERTTRLIVSGSTQTNFLKLVGTDNPTTSVSLSAKANTLYRGDYPVFPIGGYIEFVTTIQGQAWYGTTTYPLYLGTLDGITNGWWNPTLITQEYTVSGFITLPGFHLVSRYNDINICDTYNTTFKPIYSNVNSITTIQAGAAIDYFISSYVLTAIN